MQSGSCRDRFFLFASNSNKKTGGCEMKKRFIVLFCIAGLVMFASMPIVHAADQQLQKAMTYEVYLSLPKLETVTQEVPGNYADTKIEYTSFKPVDGIDRYYMYCYTGKGGTLGIKTLAHDYKGVRDAARNLMAKLCDGKKVIVESDLFYPTYFTTQFRCE